MRLCSRILQSFLLHPPRRRKRNLKLNQLRITKKIKILRETIIKAISRTSKDLITTISRGIITNRTVVVRETKRLVL